MSEHRVDATVHGVDPEFLFRCARQPPELARRNSRQAAFAPQSQVIGYFVKA